MVMTHTQDLSPSEPILSSCQQAILTHAASNIAPSWPLDKLIAVNPLWSMVNQPYDQVATELSALANIRVHLPLETYIAWYEEGRIQLDKLEKAAKQYGLTLCSTELLNHLSKPRFQPTSWQSIADLADQQRPATKMSWHDEITHQVSQFCAAHYQKQSPTLRQKDSHHEIGLYPHWLEITTEDRGLSIIMGEANLSRFFHELPKDQNELFALAIRELGINDEALAVYAYALLLDINGWSSYLAYLNWPSNTEGDQQEQHVMALLAIKMAWELVIWRYLNHAKPASLSRITKKWTLQKKNIESLYNAHRDALVIPKIWALALEYSEQADFHLTLQEPAPSQEAFDSPQLRAIFCIDVRSEVYRRALEKQSNHIQTLGFAGFFGLPIEYQAKDTQFTRPQLPGLLSPAITVSETKSNTKHVHHQQNEARWHRWGHAAPAAFSMVESMGWWYAFKMFKQTLFPKRQVHPVNRLAPNTQWQLTQQGMTLTDQDKANLAKGILDTMGLKHYAPIVMLVGHGSHTSNNLHAAGLECGACGGQSGEVNVKVLVTLLNDTKVRTLLKQMGANIPDTTQFIAALHNTTTDQLTCFESVDRKISDWLEQATYLAQKERAKKLDASLVDLSNLERFHAFIQRANDWSQVSPEWGLANNHSFIIAPRHKTRHMDLKGRSFLHDYDANHDPDFSILERLLTAPMLVAHWINMQYNLSVTDNYKFGSGNKVLHNAVGGNIGVFEGNGGDLRIGLPMQSISDGTNWMHTPVRLAVYINAPKHAIEQITAKHDIVRQLIDNDWLYLFQWDNGNNIERFYKKEWLNTSTDR
ncbi:YbcC family protein [Marinomonas spartinae]|uniref:YbcC family protein n=1 Tax=Marinomonas spartinae TaxID=1792290 RepID=UPI001F226B46|nr:DUF2309 domain-containing protein [Marinomonas spartinae]